MYSKYVVFVLNLKKWKEKNKIMEPWPNPFISDEVGGLS